MVEINNNPVWDLEGTHLIDYQILADEIPAPDIQKAFLDAVEIIANSDPNGLTTTIDPGDETVGMADLLVRSFPQLNHQSITSSHISDYMAVLAAVREPLTTEAQVRDLIASIQKKPTERQITFQGKKYHVGSSNLNAIINDALEKAGSKFRIFIAVHSENGPAAVIFGQPDEEKKVTLGGLPIRLLIMSRPEMIVNVSTTMLAVNDKISTVVVLGKHLEQLLTERRTAQRISTHYRSDVHRAVYTDFFGKQGGVDEKNLRLMSRLVLAHEQGHFEAQEKHGREYKYLAEVLRTNGDFSLKILDELISDLSAVRAIVELAESDPQQALESFLVWSVLRGPQFGTNELEKSEGCVSNLLLSAARIEGGHVAVDWKRLGSNLSSLTQMLNENFSEIGRNIRADIVGLTTPNGDPESVFQVYEGVKRELVAKLKAGNPELDEIMAREDATSRLVYFAASRRDALGRPFLVSFMTDMIRYQRLIDDWMKTHLGLTNETVPFKAPVFETINLKDLTPEMIERLRQSGQ